jgi:hypothetical protein
VTWRSTWASSGPAAKSTPEQNGTFGLATIAKDPKELKEPVVAFFRALLLVRALAAGGERRWRAIGWWPAVIERPRSACCAVPPVM